MKFPKKELTGSTGNGSAPSSKFKPATVKMEIFHEDPIKTNSQFHSNNPR
jgi:hypothetical protein